jgi:hypothetical protein
MWNKNNQRDFSSANSCHLTVNIQLKNDYKRPVHKFSKPLGNTRMHHGNETQREPIAEL